MGILHNAMEWTGERDSNSHIWICNPTHNLSVITRSSQLTQRTCAAPPASYLGSPGLGGNAMELEWNNGPINAIHQPGKTKEGPSQNLSRCQVKSYHVYKRRDPQPMHQAASSLSCSSKQVASTAHHASRFLNWSSLPTYPLNEATKWRMESKPISTLVFSSLSQISS